MTLFKDIDVAIMCGGLGTRLYPHTRYTPKCLMDIEGRPFLEILLAQVNQLQPNKVILCTGHLHEEVAAWAKKRNVVLSRDKERQGDAYPLTYAPIESPRVLVLNGDSYAAVDWVTVLEQYKSPATTYLVPKFGKGERRPCFRMMDKEFLKRLEPDVPLEKTLLWQEGHRVSLKGMFHDFGETRTYKRAPMFFRAYCNV